MAFKKFPSIKLYFEFHNITESKEYSLYFNIKIIIFICEKTTVEKN